jgi:hypothetical protein
MKNLTNKSAVVLLLLSFNLQFDLLAQDCGCDHQITGNSDNINIVEASGFDYSAGDVFCIAAGDYKSFRFIGFEGTEEAPLIFKNCGGVVNIEGPTYTGVAFIESKYIRFTGTGDESVEYGIRINYTKDATSGFSVAQLSSDFEIDHLEIGNTGFAGIMAKTDPDCSRPETWRENYTLKNLKIHHNYIHDTEGEGMYIGGTFGYESSTRVCDGIERFAHLLENVSIYDNLLEDTGWDGIQVNLTPLNAKIFNNTINGYGKGKVYAQNQGMSLGALQGRIYNNKIIQKPEYTTEDQMGMSIISIFSETYFYNNLIVGSGSYGIWMHQRMSDGSFDTNGGFYFLNNTIIRPGKSGTFFNSRSSNGSGVRPYLKDVYINNVVIDPGSDYEGSGFWKGIKESYFDFNDREDSEGSNFATNFMERGLDTLKFADISQNIFMPLEGSRLIDAGTDVSNYNVTSDINGGARPFGDAYDMGAYEFGATNIAPLIEAVIPQTVIVNEVFTLDASASTDDGEIISFKWEVVDEANQDLIEIEDPNNPITEAVLKAEGNFIIRLTITDDLGAESSQDFTIISNIPLGLRDFVSTSHQNLVASAYPNPFKDKVYIILNDNFSVSKLRLYNKEGKLIDSYSISELEQYEEGFLLDLNTIDEMVYLVFDGKNGQDFIKLVSAK